MLTKPPSIALALDIGGTKIKAGLITQEGEILALKRMKTPPLAPPEQIIKVILEVAHDLCHQTGLEILQLAGVGISIAAFITAEGIVTATAHLSPAWLGYDIRSRLNRDLPANYYFGLDAPVPTLGEAYYGAGKGIQDFVHITVSTGIGAGIVANGKYYTGGLGWAGGVGHIIIDETSHRICSGCGNAGCLETFAATQGILTTARELLASNSNSLLRSITSGDLNLLTPKIILEACLQGDAVAREVFNRAGHALGLGLVSLVDIVAPQRVIIGGGISQAGEVLLGPARALVQARAFPPRLRQVEIVQTPLADLAGIFGAAVMVFHDIRINVSQEVLN